MNKNDFQDLLELNEGRRKFTYVDTNDHPTVGVGFNLDRSDARLLIKNLGLDYNDVLNGKQALSDTQIDSLLRLDMAKATTGAQAEIKNFDDLSDGRQLAIADMVFNLGQLGFSRFVKAIAAIKTNDWETAAEEMK